MAETFDGSEVEAERVRKLTVLEDGNLEDDSFS